MKFFTLFTISALAVVSNTQEPVFMGDKALVIDYAEGHRRLQQLQRRHPTQQKPVTQQAVSVDAYPKPQFPQANSGEIQVNSRLLQGLQPRLISMDYLPDENRPRNLQGVQFIKGEDDPIARRLQIAGQAVAIDFDPINRRLQDVYPIQLHIDPVNRRLLASSSQHLTIEHDLPINQRKPIEKPSRPDIMDIPIDKQINQPLFIIEPAVLPEHQQNPFDAPPAWDPYLEQNSNDHFRPSKHETYGNHDRRNRQHERHGEYEDKIRPVGPELMEDPYENSDFNDYRDYQKESHNKSNKVKHAIFKGFLWAAGITLMILLCAKCCCGKKNCGKRSPQCRNNGGNVDQQINFHLAEVARLEEMKRNAYNRNVRVINPYNQMIQPQNFIAQPNPYQIPQQYENERIAFGQRPIGNFREQPRNIPMGRQIPENSFEHEYPTL